MVVTMSTEREALERIAALHPDTDSTESYNEWGEADCFRQAVELARQPTAQDKP
jgi:hypothetical protein